MYHNSLSHWDEKSVGINRNYSQGSENVIELKKTQKKKMEIPTPKKRSNSGRREKSEKEGLFRRRRGAWTGWMGLSAANAPPRGVARVKTVSHAPLRANARISGPNRRSKRVSKCSCFPARLPPEGRSKGVAPVGVLFGRNGGSRKISPVKVANGKVLRRWFGFYEAS